MNLSMKQEQTPNRENRFVVTKGEVGLERDGIGISRCKLLYREWKNDKVLLYSRENYIQYPLINHNGKEYEKESIYKKVYIYIYIHFAVQKKLIEYCKSTIIT